MKKKFELLESIKTYEWDGNIYQQLNKKFGFDFEDDINLKVIEGNITEGVFKKQMADIDLENQNIFIVFEHKVYCGWKHTYCGWNGRFEPARALNVQNIHDSWTYKELNERRKNTIRTYVFYQDKKPAKRKPYVERNPRYVSSYSEHYKAGKHRQYKMSFVYFPHNVSTSEAFDKNGYFVWGVKESRKSQAERLRRERMKNIIDNYDFTEDLQAVEGKKNYIYAEYHKAITTTAFEDTPLIIGLEERFAYFYKKYVGLLKRVNEKKYTRYDDYLKDFNSLMNYRLEIIYDVYYEDELIDTIPSYQSNQFMFASDYANRYLNIDIWSENYGKTKAVRKERE